MKCFKGKLTLLLSLYFFLSACGTPVKEQKKTPFRDDMGVSLGGEERPQVFKKPQIVDQSQSRQIGPAMPGQDKNNYGNRNSQKHDPVLALSLGPGLYRVTGHISLLKLFDRQKTPVRIITGYGLAAVVAAHFAMGTTPEIIEWKFFKTLKAVQGLRPYSQKWLSRVEKYLLKSLKGKRIQDAKLVLMIPVYDKQKGRVVFKKRGNLYQILLANLTLNRQTRGNRYQAAILYDVFGQGDTLTKGADITIGLGAMGREIALNHGNGFLVGVYGKAAALSERNKSRSDLHFDLPVGDAALDSIKDISNYMQQCERYGKSVTAKLDEYITQWVEKKKE